MDGRYNLSCDPRSSFIPAQGTDYYLDFESEDESCTAFVYRESSTKPAGVDFEPSFEGGGLCGDR